MNGSWRPASWSPGPDRSVRSRFTVLYVTLFALSGAGLLVLTNVFALSGLSHSQPVPGTEPRVPAAAQQVAGLQSELDRLREEQTRQLLAGSAAALGVMLLVSVGLGRVVAGHVLMPLRKITETTRRISADNLHERLGVIAPRDEVKDLADTIDSLLERLQGSFSAQRSFVANASHELRTPLATMRAALDVAVAKPGPVQLQTQTLNVRLRAELDHMDRLLEGLLMLAGAQHPDRPERDVVRLDRLVADAVDARAAEFAARGRSLERALPGTVRVDGNRTLLARMVANLIDNALVHGGTDDAVRVRVTTADGTAVLVVETGGPELDPAQVARLGQPFRRLGRDRTGTGGSGLGLSIVAAVVTAHGGRLALTARPEGGLRVTVSLPLVPGPAGITS